MPRNNKKLCYTFVVFAAMLSGCSYNLQLMPRDSGKVYKGEVSSNGMGSGTVSIAMDGKTCSGPFVTSKSGASVGIGQAFGQVGTTPFNTTAITTVSGASQYKAIMTCSDGSGLRCDVQGEYSGAGVCIDNNSRVYDLMYQ